MCIELYEINLFSSNHNLKIINLKILTKLKIILKLEQPYLIYYNTMTREELVYLG